MFGKKGKTQIEQICYVLSFNYSMSLFNRWNCCDSKASKN